MKMVMLMTPPMCLVLHSLHDADANEQQASAASHNKQKGAIGGSVSISISESGVGGLAQSISKQ